MSWVRSLTNSFLSPVTFYMHAWVSANPRPDHAFRFMQDQIAEKPQQSNMKSRSSAQRRAFGSRAPQQGPGVIPSPASQTSTQIRFSPHKSQENRASMRMPDNRVESLLFFQVKCGVRPAPSASTASQTGLRILATLSYMSAGSSCAWESCSFTSMSCICSWS